MQFTNLVPDTNPDGSRFIGGSIGIRYFYFTFIATTKWIDVFLTRNIYRNEESITKIFTRVSNASLLLSNVSNVTFPCVFFNGQITVNTANGVRYENKTNIPDFKLNNLTVGATYILESRTIYNDPGMDFGAYILGSRLTYVQSSTVPVMPNLPIPLPPMPMPIPPPLPTTGLPPIPTGLGASSAICGVSLTWIPTAQTTEYLIYKEGLLISSSTSPNYTDSQVISGNPYTYTVSALNSIGESAQSAPRNITPIFSFTSLTPDRTPMGAVIASSNIRYYYFLFTPITPSIDVYCYNGTSSTKKAIIGIYDTTETTRNYLTSANLSNLSSSVTFASHTLGSLIVDGLTVSESTNSAVVNFTINLPISDLTKPSANIKTFILEVVSYSPDIFTSDFGLKFKSTQLNYNSVKIAREVPSPYSISYDFSDITASVYTQYIYPNIVVFQNIKNVLESIITNRPTIRGVNRTNDMLVNFTVTELGEDVLGQSSLNKWVVDSSRAPDFPYEQSITFNTIFFKNGYMTGQANFNGSSTVNGISNINLFNVLLHEMMHGIGIFYTDSYNTTSANVGWNPLLDISNNTWYKGPINSVALSSYRAYCKNSGLQRVPVEENYGPGTALSHWDEGSAPNIPVNYRYFNGIYHPAPIYEIMTGFLNNNEYMTGLTGGALKDYGYTVNLGCPYVVAHPYANLMPIATSSIRVKCTHISSDSKVKHTIFIEKIQNEPSLFNYLQQIGYYTPVYY